jgi:hypothetical protein
MSPASAAGVLECLRTKDAEDTDGRRTTCLILDRGYESPEDVDEGALLRSHEDDPTDVIGAHGGRYFQYPVQSALANASKGVEAVLHEAPDQDAAEVYPSGVQGGPILALQYPTDTPDWVIGAGQKVEPTHGRRLQRIFYRAVRQWDEQDGAYQTFLIMYDPGSRGHQGYCVEALDTKCLPVFALKSEQPLRIVHGQAPSQAQQAEEPARRDQHPEVHTRHLQLGACTQPATVRTRRQEGSAGGEGRQPGGVERERERHRAHQEGAECGGHGREKERD